MVKGEGNLINDSSGIKNEDERISGQYNIGLITIGILPVIALNTRSWYGNNNTHTMLVTALTSFMILLMLGIVLLLLNREKEEKNDIHNKR
ncbi:hypothetical protein [Methanolacinia petrolearia]|uniref:hypothetical protein n=1 Tax=Methanolacinia petrolearia TaxID=54120 RepID=UPI003BAA3CA4